jgi:hypothetical protein
MRILWVGTKTPWPPIDGGRLVASVTLDALAAAGVHITFVAPRGATNVHISSVHASSRIAPTLTDDRPRPWTRALVTSLWSGRPATIERHAAPRLAAVVAHLMRTQTFDVVHVEQLQASIAAAPARAYGLPSVLRTHNVESAIWASAALGRAWPTALLQRLEGRRVRAFEATALAEVDAVIALSAVDAAALRLLAPTAHVHVAPPPWPSALPPVISIYPGLEQHPTFVWIGSRGWSPNDDAVRWLGEAIWPAIRAGMPDARLHTFGAALASAPGLSAHPSPADSAEAFWPGAILLLPLRQAAGVRMRVLEAWARSVPVIATDAALAGLDATDGDDVLIANEPAAFAQAAESLVRSPDLRARLVAGGRRTLVARHDPEAIARQMLEVYRAAIARRSRSRATR